MNASELDNILQHCSASANIHVVQNKHCPPVPFLLEAYEYLSNIMKKMRHGCVFSEPDKINFSNICLQSAWRKKMNIFLLCISKNCAQVFWIETFCRYATLKILVFYFRWCSLTYQKYSCSDQLRSVAFFITEYTM